MCQIPYARGSSRSVLPEKILTEVKRLGDSGVREIVFTGIHIGDYGKDLDCFSNQTELPFVTVLKKILKFRNIDRIRISV